MTLLKNKILLRNAIFLALAFVVLPAYGGPPLLEVFGCEDFQLTYTGGYPAAGCFGFGVCTLTGSGDLFVDILLYSNMDALIRLCLMRLR